MLLPMRVPVPMPVPVPMLLLFFLLLLCFPVSRLRPGGTCRASPWERLRREAKAGRGLSDEGGARRGPCPDARARERSRWRSRAHRYASENVRTDGGESRLKHETALAGCPFRRWRVRIFGREALGPCFRRDDVGSFVKDPFYALSPDFRQEPKKRPTSRSSWVHLSRALSQKVPNRHSLPNGAHKHPLPQYSGLARHRGPNGLLLSSVLGHRAHAEESARWRLSKAASCLPRLQPASGTWQGSVAQCHWAFAETNCINDGRRT